MEAKDQEESKVQEEAKAPEEGSKPSPTAPPPNGGGGGAEDGGGGAEDLPESDVKVILLGDSAVGKSKLVERFLMDNYQPRQNSTYALTLFRHRMVVDGKSVEVDFWDTAGQEQFDQMHPAYYYQAHACVLVFDVTRKATYKHLVQKDSGAPGWYEELRQYCEHIPVLCCANKIDIDRRATQKKFGFPEKHGCVGGKTWFCSASEGDNVVALFEEAIRQAVAHKEHMLSIGDEEAEVQAFLSEPGWEFATDASPTTDGAGGSAD